MRCKALLACVAGYTSERATQQYANLQSAALALLTLLLWRY